MEDGSEVRERKRKLEFKCVTHMYKFHNKECNHSMCKYIQKEKEPRPKERRREGKEDERQELRSSTYNHCSQGMYTLCTQDL